MREQPEKSKNSECRKVKVWKARIQGDPANTDEKKGRKRTVKEFSDIYFFRYEKHEGKNGK